jgi:acetylornithine deacetylase
VGVGYGTEASEVHAAGIPCVVLGPGDGAKAHSDDESIDLDQLEACARVYERIMLSPAS